MTIDQKNQVTSTLTAEERKELATLERRFSKGQRDSIAALRKIRQKKLFRATHKTFDDYMAARWGKTRNWATQQIGWLRRQELLESLDQEFGKEPYQLSVAEAMSLAPLEPKGEFDDPDLLAELYLQAVKEAQEEADADGVKRTTEMVKKAVERKKQFLQNRQDFGTGLTQDESEHIDRLKDEKSFDDIRTILSTAREQSKKEDRPASECLKQLADEAVTSKSSEDKAADQTGFDADQAAPDVDHTVPDVDQTGPDDELADNTIYEVEPYGDLSDMVTTKTPVRVDRSKLREILDLVQDHLEMGTFTEGGVRFRLIPSEEADKAVPDDSE